VARHMASVSRMDDLEAAWDDLHDATPSSWFVGRPGQRHDGSALDAF